MRVKLAAFVIAVLVACAQPARAQGNLSANPYAPDSTSNPYGAGSPFNPNSVNNPYGRYGSPFSPQSANNPYTTDAPRLYDSQGNYHGKLSANPYDPDSTSIPSAAMAVPTRPIASRIPSAPAARTATIARPIPTAPACISRAANRRQDLRSRYSSTMVTSMLP